MADAVTTIFISYAHADSPFVDQLQADLQQQGFVVWVDRRGLAGGQHWRRELQEAIDRADVLLVVLSPDAVASQYVQIEYGYATEEGKLVIPLYYRPCKVPMELRNVQWVDFQHSYDQGLAVLVDGLHRHEQKTAAPISPSPGAPPPNEQDVPVKAEPLWKIPSTFTSLIGREQEVEEISVRLRQPEVRLVTLLGPGGIGKTRLSIAVAKQLRPSFEGGICFVPLAAISDPQFVLPMIAQELGLKDSGTRPLPEQLQSFLGKQPFLLVLDNFEQIVAAAPEVEVLLANCPQLKIVVTSRAVLHLSAEQVVQVAPLALPSLSTPDTQGIAESAAVSLFVQRARSTLPSFQLTPTNRQAVAEICIRLDGLPLAIELAAARVKLLPPQALLTRLSQRLQLLTGGPRSLPARQQTLRSTIQWSYDLLEREEQALFRLLAVFVGGWTLEAAEGLCKQIGKVDLDVLNTLSALLDNSLIQPSGQEDEESRFLMLQTVREFGLEVLDASGELQATQAAHARYILALAEQAEPELYGPNQTAWVGRLEQEHENLRAALSWLLEQARMPEGEQQAEQCLRLCIALHWFWWVRGYVREADSFLEQALETSAGVSTLVRARALYAATGSAIDLGDLERAERQGEESLALFQELGDKASIAVALQQLGYLARVQCRYARARAQLEEARALFQELGDPWKRGNCLTELARLDIRQGTYDHAHMLLEESLGIYQALGDQQRISWVLFLLAYALFLSQTDLERALVLAEQSLALAREGGSLGFLHFPLILLGELHLKQGRALFEESLLVAKEQGGAFGQAASLIGLAQVEAYQGDLAVARRLYQEGFAHLREPGEKEWEWIAACLMGLAEMEAVQREPTEAARLWGTVEALLQAIGAPIPPAYGTDYEQAVATARSQVSEEVFAAAWQEGRTMMLEQVIDDVLQRRDEADKQ